VRKVVGEKLGLLATFTSLGVLGKFAREQSHLSVKEECR
jgi:hypothetical protein